MRRFATVIVWEAGSANNAHDDALQAAMNTRAVYVGRPIEVPDAVEYSTDSIYLRHDGEFSMYESEVISDE